MLDITLTPFELTEATSPQGSDTARWFSRRTLYRLVPAFDSLRHYSLAALRCDLVAGLTVATVAVPQAIAYAVIAGVPPQYGLYTAMVMTLVGALFNSSRQLINGPTNAIAIATWSVLSPLPDNERISAAALLALLVGLMQLGFTWLRFGKLLHYVSPAVVIGFTLGASVLLVLDQLKNLLGLPAQGARGDLFLKRFWLTMTAGEIINHWTVLVGVGTILVILGVHWLNARVRIRLPELLISLVVMSALSALCDLPAKGVAVVGAIPAELPSFVAPHVEGGAAGKLIVGAAAIAALGLLEAVAMARTIAARTGQPLDVRQQCRSEGLANLAGSFFQCIPGSGSLTRSSINYHVGALTQWSGVFAALAVGAAVLLFAPLAGSIPCAALAGILMVTAWRLIDHVRLIAQFRSRPGRAALVLALAGAAIVISIEWSILVGIALSLLVSAFTNQHVHSRTPAPAAHRPPAKCVDAL